MTSARGQSTLSEGVSTENAELSRAETVLENLLAVCRAYLSHSGCPPFSAELWQEVAALATQHRLGPVVWKVFTSDPDGGLLSSSSLSDLRQEVRENSRWSLLLTSELLRLMEGFQERGIVAVPLKGPSLARELYGDVSLRVFSDLDFLTPSTSLPEVLDVLRQRGYRLRSRRADPPGEKAIEWFIRIGRGEIPLIHPRKSVQVDLHWNLLGQARGTYPLPSRILSQHPLMIAGYPVPRLRKEDLLLYLSLHGFKHGWLRLNWLMDLALLVRLSCEDLDLAYLRSRIRRTETKVALTVGLMLAWSLLGAGRQNLAEDLMEEGCVVRGKRIASRVIDFMKKRPWDTKEAPRARVLPLMMAANPGPWRKGLRLLRLTAALGYEDIDVLRLPVWTLVPYLYYPCRCLRLLGKFAPRIGRAG